MIQRVKAMGLLVVSAVLFATLASSQDSTDTWRGLVVAPEHRCSPYDKKRDYPYSQSIEQDIVRGLGRVYGPYTDTCFVSARETDIEHIVATSEAHDSGLLGTTSHLLPKPRGSLPCHPALLTKGVLGKESQAATCLSIDKRLRMSSSKMPKPEFGTL